MKDEQIAELLYQSLETEKGGIEICASTASGTNVRLTTRTTASPISRNSRLGGEWLGEPSRPPGEGIARSS
jgi:hypothetical protein